MIRIKVILSFFMDKLLRTKLSEEYELTSANNGYKAITFD
jgi:hypothetical protein